MGLTANSAALGPTPNIAALLSIPSNVSTRVSLWAKTEASSRLPVPPAGLYNKKLNKKGSLGLVFTIKPVYLSLLRNNEVKCSLPPYCPPELTLHKTLVSSENSMQNSEGVLSKGRFNRTNVFKNSYFNRVVGHIILVLSRHRCTNFISISSV